VSEAGNAPAGRQAPISDLFATAVHRFGNAWADLVVACVVVLAVATVPVLIARSGSSDVSYIAAVCVFSYGIAYFVLLGHVMLRGMPERAPARTVAETYATAAVVGAVSALLTVETSFFFIALVPLVLLIVPAVAAGDRSPLGAFWRGPQLAVVNFGRTWAVWLITIAFCMPIAIAMFLVVQAFAGSITGTLLALALAAPIGWPVSALFVRALYGDLTGRRVVAPQDRTG
jgi:hypothetical protein